MAEHADFSILRKWNNKKGSYELSNKLCNLVYEIHLQIGAADNLNNWIHIVASNLDHDYDYIKGAAHKYKKA